MPICQFLTTSNLYFDKKAIRNNLGYKKNLIFITTQVIVTSDNK